MSRYAVAWATLPLTLPLMLAGPATAEPNPDLPPGRQATLDWFHDAGWGVFVHYLTGVQNNPEHIASLGRQTSWDEAVAEFDTERFAEAMAEVGAGYVIFTVMQISRHLIAPNDAFNEISGYAPGEAAATRDLIADLADSLGRRGIPLMLYYTGDGPRGDPQAGPAFGWSNPVTRAFVEKWARVAREYGERYGEQVVGWWVDGSYPFIGYDDELLGILADALRAGNPNRIVAFNPGVEVRYYSAHDDYLTGEQNVFHEMPVERYVNGRQWHLLSYLGDHWAAPGTQYTKRELAEYVFDVNQRGGVVSIDVMVYRDGSLDRSQFEMLRAVGEQHATGQAWAPVPPGNRAYRKPARLLSLDGSHELIPSAEVNVARHGVDGNPATVAQGAQEWPWTYHVDLLDTIAARRLKITFGGTYATVFDVQLSTDGETWRTVAERDGHDGSPVELTLDGSEVRYVRVRGLKPDGPDQPGGQMAIAELEVYD